jgi:lauroyl/myristoyl acyltransferase
MLRKLKAKVKLYLRTALEGFFILILFPLLALLPYGWGYGFTRWLGNRNFRMMDGMREEILRNLSQCMPEKSEEERLELTRQLFQIQASFLYDGCQLMKYPMTMWTDKYVRLEGKEHLEESLKKGNGAIFCTLHLNHYFYPAGLLGVMHPSVAYGVWPGDLKKVNPFMRFHQSLLIKVGEWRSGTTFLAAGRHPKGALEAALRENKIVFIPFDMALPEMRDLRAAKFFGQDIMFPWGLIMVKYLTKAAFHIGYITREPGEWKRQTLVFTPELNFSGKLAQDQQLVVSELEKVIRKHPGLWWGWGMLSAARPDFVKEARMRRDYATSILVKEKERSQGASKK